MKSKNATQLIQKIDDTISDIKSLELLCISFLNKAYLAKFLVVYISGLYEKIIKNILADRALSKGDMAFANFILEYRWYSPKFDNIISLLDSFNKNWSIELKKMDIEYKEAVSSIANNKNSIAHGNDVFITLNDVYDYYNKSKILIEKIDEIIMSE